MFRKMFRYSSMRMIQNILLIFCTVLVINGMINGSALAADRNVIIGFHQSDAPSEEKLVHDNGGKLKKTFRLISAVSANMSDENITKLKKDSRVAYVENDSIYKAADEYTSSWGVQHIGSQPVHNQSIDGTGVNIAVLDTGIYYNHEDLNINYKGGFDIINNDNDPWDDNCITSSQTCHGTHVSGTIAAQSNGIGVVGVAPRANIYAVKVLDAGGFGHTSFVISGIEWAIANNMSIISMSLSCNPNRFDPCNSTALNDTINNAYNSGILLVAAAGNNDGGAVTYPALYENVIAVSATDANDKIASFSSIGPKVELAAPGVNINSTVCVGPNYTCMTSGYGMLSGTSMAAPHVTGVAALIMSHGFDDVNGDGEKNNEDVRKILQQTARDIGDPGRDDKYGFGIVDASNAVIGIPPPVPVVPPAIINSAPTSPANDNVGESRTFNITIDQLVNVTWYINGTLVGSIDGVTNAQYTNNSASSGIWNVTVIASNVNGSAMNSWIWNVTPLPPPIPALPPVIISSAPTSPVNDIAGASRTFNITIDQIVNVTWYINGTLVGSIDGVTNAQYTNISASSGIWNVTVVASNVNGSVMRSWTWNVTSIPPPKPGIPPSIRSSAPSSPVNDIAGASRTFKITIDQIVNVTWYINGTPIQFNRGVKDAHYTNISASPGTWNVSAIATNVNGNAMRSWTWNVIPKIPPVSTINLILKRTNVSSAVDIQKVNLSKGKYSINIHNINLTEVDMKVYYNGVLQKRLSGDFEFNKKNNDINFDLTVNNANVTFIPYGKIGSIGYLTIKRR